MADKLFCCIVRHWRLSPWSSNFEAISSKSKLGCTPGEITWWCSCTIRWCHL